MVTMLTNSTHQLIQLQNKPSTFVLKAMEQSVIKPEDNSDLDRVTDLTGTWQTKNCVLQPVTSYHYTFN